MRHGRQAVRLRWHRRGEHGVSFAAPPPEGTAPPPPPPFEVTITAAPGTYAFHCRIHPQMDGTLTVVAAGGTTTTADELASASAAQVKEDVVAGTAAEAAANTAGKQQNADGTTTWTLAAGTSSPDGHTVVLEMLPADVTVKPGDTVTWTAQGSDEVHTVTFPDDLQTDLVPLCEQGGADTIAAPGHTPPQGPFDFVCGSGPAQEIEFGGGNGVAAVTSPTTVSDSGLIGTKGIAALWGVPDNTMLSSWSVSFKAAAPGSYSYVCQIHDGMKGAITVATS
jgi:plastocyanin